MSTAHPSTLDPLRRHRRRAGRERRVDHRRRALPARAAARRHAGAGHDRRQGQRDPRSRRAAVEGAPPRRRHAGDAALDRSAAGAHRDRRDASSRASARRSPAASRTVFVERGQTVAAGAPLFTVASPNIAELRAEREKAEVDLEVAKANLERVKAVVAAHAAAEKERARRRAGVPPGRGRARSWRWPSCRHQRRRRGDGNEVTVTAPRDGIVVEKNVAVAQRVSPDTAEPLIVVADLSTVWVVADLFEADAQSDPRGRARPRVEPVDARRRRARRQGRAGLGGRRSRPPHHPDPRAPRQPAAALRPNVYAQVRFVTGRPRDGVEVRPRRS